MGKRKNLDEKILDRILSISIVVIVLHLLFQFIEAFTSANELDHQQVIVTLVILSLYASYYLLKRTKLSFKLIKVSVYLIFTLSVFGSFFNLGGFNGVTSLDFAHVLFIGIFAFPKSKDRWVVLSGFVLMMAFFIYIQTVHPSVINHNLIFDEKFTLAFGLLTRVVLSINLAIVIIEEYKKEKLEVDDLLDQLKAANGNLHNSNKELTETLEALHKTQSQFIEREKMASIGTLTSGLAHEINNPLNYIKGGSDLLAKQLHEQGKSDEESGFALESINSGIKRISDIVDGLNLIARNDNHSSESFEIHTVIDNCLTVLNSKIKYDFEVEKKYERGIRIEGNVSQIHQSILNILLNAIEFTKESGLIKIAMASQDDAVRIDIIDNGTGIKKDNLSRAIDPFYTTKEPGQGVGLGLTIAYSIIKAHHGTLEIEPNPESGTKVSIVLPREI